MQSPHTMADSLPIEPHAWPYRPLILVQTFDPEQCKARCQRTHDFCVQSIKKLPDWTGRDIIQSYQDRCETNYENCVRDCQR